MRWSSLKEFVGWYLAQIRGGFRTPHCGDEGTFKSFDPFIEIVLFREDCYQAEFIYMRPNCIVKPHRHPNVSSIDVHLSGAGEAYIGGRLMPQADSSTSPTSVRRKIPIPAGVPHWGKSFDEVSVISLQRWKNGVTPTFITDDWEAVECVEKK